jgi:selenide,water dikinase
VLAQMVAPLAEMFPAEAHPEVRVGLGAVDDAAVYELGGGRVAVVSLDVFPPVVDGAEDYGAIAAVNSMSDVWAMGADPALALNIALFPADMPPEISGQILHGAAERVRAAGAVVAGGHTMDSKEPAFGLTVIGFCDAHQLMTKGGLRPGQRLVLTKPLGSGLLTTAAKRGRLEPAGLTPVIAMMRHLNQGAAAAARAHGVRSATDITGFGLVGHALEMAEASGTGLRLWQNDIPLVPGAAKWAAEGTFAGGCYRNRMHYAPRVRFDPALPEHQQLLLFDPQTSGGLLLAVDPDALDPLLSHLHETDLQAAEIGEVVDGDGIEVVPAR